MCDCLERDGEFDEFFYYDVVCDRNAKGGDHNSADCFDVQAHPPIVQSSINGIKVCGKRAEG